MTAPYETPPDALDRELVFEFVWRFSVFECALKREGFLQRVEGGRDAALPDWDSFAKSIVGRFSRVRVDGFEEAKKFLAAHPPQQQVVCDNQLAWKPLEQKSGESHEVFVIRLIKTARNNLFHGGKYPDGPIAEVARDTSILRAASRSLRGATSCTPGLLVG